MVEIIIMFDRMTFLNLEKIIYKKEVTIYMVEAGNVTGLLRDLINVHGKAFGFKSAIATDCDSLYIVDIDNTEHKVIIDGVEI